MCWENDKCDCYRLNRECDPDLCLTCGAHEVLDPINRYRHDIEGKCTNVSIQRGRPRRTLLGHSKLLRDGGVDGWGLYMGEATKKGDYIGEYVGEVITKEESEARGTIYNKRNMSYLFDLNSSKHHPLIYASSLLMVVQLKLLTALSSETSFAILIIKLHLIRTAMPKRFSATQYTGLACLHVGTSK